MTPEEEFFDVLIYGTTVVDNRVAWIMKYKQSPAAVNDEQYGPEDAA